MPPHRIGFDAIRALRNTTGLGNYSRGVLRALHRAGPSWHLQLYTSRDPLPAFASLPAELGARLIRPRRWGARVPGLWRTFHSGRCAASYGVEIYHGLSHEIPRDLPGTGVPSVVTFHDLIFEKHPEFFPFIDRASYRWRYRWSARHAGAVVAVSSQTRDDLVERYAIDPARIAVVPPPRLPAFGLPVAPAELAAVRARHGLPPEYLLSLGTLEPRKNHRLLIAALATLAPAEAPPLVLAGRDGGALGALRRAIAERGLDDRVRILTDVASADLPALMHGATLFLYPSLAEGFGMPIVEALGAGTPVIASAGGCLGEAGGPDSRYVAAGDPEGWAGAIRDLVADPAARARMREAGRSWAVQFDGDRVAARLIAVYDAVVSGGPLPAPSPGATPSMARTH